MAIVDDYAGIAAELRRIRGERVPQEQPQRPAKSVAVYVNARGAIQIGIRPRRAGKALPCSDPAHLDHRFTREAHVIHR